MNKSLKHLLTYSLIFLLTYQKLEKSEKNVIITSMIRKLLVLLSLFFTVNLCVYSAEMFDNIQLPIRDYDGIELPAGTFIPVINAQDISTQYCPEGYKVEFISTNDLYLYETNIIPKGTKFYGYVEDIHEPVIGTHASMKIRINKMILPDNFEIPIKAYVYTSNANMIGGGLTEPAEYVKMPHYQQSFQGRFWINRGPTLQIRPGNKRKMGEHTRINAGENLIIVITSPAYVTHTLTD